MNKLFFISLVACYSMFGMEQQPALDRNQQLEQRLVLTSIELAERDQITADRLLQKLAETNPSLLTNDMVERIEVLLGRNWKAVERFVDTQQVPAAK